MTNNPLMMAHERAIAAAVRDVFGAPSPVVIERASLDQSSGAATIAQAIYEKADFSSLPILADALEDAGCTDRAILDHCRQPGEHVRGCWVVDLVLGKQ